MKKLSNNQLLFLAILFSVFAVAGRLLPHAWNFTPLGALFIFSGFILPRRALALPFTAILATDLIIGTYDWRIMAAVYGTFLAVAFIAYSLRGHYSFWTILTTSLAGSLAFFFVTNAAVWLWSGMYATDFSGLMTSYTAAIPFFHNSLAGDIFYTAVFFGIYEFAPHTRPDLCSRFKATAFLSTGHLSVAAHASPGARGHNSTTIKHSRLFPKVPLNPVRPRTFYPR